MTFYLQYSVSEDRSIIDTRQHDRAELRAKPIEAESWLAAKKAFGFEMTPLQTAMLGKT